MALVTRITKMKGTPRYWSLKTVTWRPTEVHSCHNRQPALRWHRQQHGPGMKPCFRDLAPWLNRTQNSRLLTAYILIFQSLTTHFLGIQYALQKKHSSFLWKKIIFFNQVDSEKGQGSKPSPGEQLFPQSWPPGLRLGEPDSAKNTHGSTGRESELCTHSERSSL